LLCTLFVASSHEVEKCDGASDVCFLEDDGSALIQGSVHMRDALPHLHKKEGIESEEDMFKDHKCAMYESGHLKGCAPEKDFDAALLDADGHFDKFCQQKWMTAVQKAKCKWAQPYYEELRHVYIKNGWTNKTADGTIFSDGKGATVGLYDKFVKAGMTTCETGLGGGHGALYTLLICPTCHVYVFDIGERPYSAAVAEFLAKKFPGRFHVVWGDSAKTLPKFHKEHPKTKCDFVMIDGGRTYKMAQTDTLNFAKMVSSPKAAALQHDCPIKGIPDFFNGVCRAWHELGRQGCVHIDKELTGVSKGHLVEEKCKQFHPPEPQSAASGLHITGLIAMAGALLMLA